MFNPSKSHSLTIFLADDSLLLYVMISFLSPTFNQLFICSTSEVEGTPTGLAIQATFRLSISPVKFSWISGLPSGLKSVMLEILTAISECE